MLKYIIGGVVLLGVVGGAYYYFVMKPKKDSSDDTITPLQSKLKSASVSTSLTHNQIKIPTL